MKSKMVSPSSGAAEFRGIQLVAWVVLVRAGGHVDLLLHLVVIFFCRYCWLRLCARDREKVSLCS